MLNFRKKLKQILTKRFIISKQIFVILIAFNIISAPSYGIITDDFVEATLDKNLKIRPYVPKVYRDEFAESNKNVSLHSSKKFKITDEELNSVDIRITAPYSTKNKLEEGSPLEFVTTRDVKINNKIYPAGTKVRARIETISPNAVWGVPADLVVGNFYINDTPLIGEIKKSGANKTIWVRPLAIAGGILIGTGFFFMFIRGGHAKIKPNETFTVYF